MERLSSMTLPKLPSAVLRFLFVSIVFFTLINSEAQCLDAFKYAMGTTGSDAAYDIVSTANGNFFVVGTTLENGTGKNVLVTKMSAGGAILWTKIYGGLGTEVVKKASKTRDNGLLITGSTGSFGNTKGEILGMRLDSDGDLMWLKKFGLNSSYGDIGMDITETSEGGYAIAGIINAFGANADMVVIRLDADANVLWNKRFDNGQGESGVGITETGNNLMITAEMQNPGADYEGIIMELDKGNGNIIRTIKLHPDTGGLNSPYISKDDSNGGYWISGNLTDKKQPSKMHQIILKLDAGLNIVKSYKLVLPEYTNNSFAGFQSMSNGGFIACSGMESSSSGFIFSIRNDGTKVFAKKLVGGRDRKLNRLQLIENKIIAVGSDNRQGNDEMFIIAFDSSGATLPPCQTDTAQLTVQSHSFTSSAFNWSNVSDIVFSNTTAVFDTRTTALNKTILCSIDCVVKDTTSVEGCGNTWLNVKDEITGVQIGDLDITGNKLTIEAKVNRTLPYDASFKGGDIVSKHSDPGDDNYLMRANGAEITTSNGFFATPDVCDIELNKTYHIALVYDGSMLKFYRNGFLLSQIPCTGNLVTNNWQTAIGTTGDISSPYPADFLGLIDEVRIWNVARTQEELKSYMNQSLPNPSAQNGLLAYYTFDDLLNKQGNTSWNGNILGSASIKNNNPTCQSFIADSCDLVVIPPIIVTADFSIPDTVCVNEPLTIKNNTTGATNFYWNFNVADINSTPEGTNLGNINNLFSLPVFTDQVYVNGNYHVFVVNNYPGGLVRLDFGSSMLNTPTTVNLGNVGGIVPNNAEGIQVVHNNGKWYALIVGGYPPGGVPSRIIKIEFGADITNPNPIGTNWGNIGNLNYPIDLHVFQENDNWYGFTVNSENNTITRFNFGPGFDNAPTAINLGNLGNLDGPTGIYAINDKGNWSVFITNGTDNSSITRLDFGSSLLNIPSAVNLGNINNTLFRPRDIYIVQFCGELVGFVVNGLETKNDIVKLNFNDNLLGNPTAASLGNIGNLYFPHSLSQMFRVGADLYSFITNVRNNTITRVRFAGTNNASTPNSSDSIPPSITYNTPGVYNINLMVDEGLPTQTSVCKAIVVKDCFIPSAVTPGFIIPDTVCVNTPVTINNTTTGGTNFYWNFCSAGFNTTPQAINLSNPDNLLNNPVYIDIVKDESGIYYGFAVNHLTRELIRYSYGNSLNNIPSGVNLGTFSNIIPDGAEGIKVVKANGKWYAIIVGGNDRLPGVDSRIIKIEFGYSLSNNTPTATNWGNIGNLDFPAELNLFQENGLWYGLTVNAYANTITRFNFGNGFDNVPTGDNLGNVGDLNFPEGLYSIKTGTDWYVFVTNRNNSLTRLSFGSSILNKPTGVNIGNPGNLLKQPRDISMILSCDGITGLVVNEQTNDIVQLNFGSDVLSNPVAKSLGNIGNLDFPHSISEITRVGNDLVAFIPNVNSSTLTKITYTGCNNSSQPNSADSIPPTITYSSPGVYNINLVVDEGLPTQTSLCKIINVVASPFKTLIFDTAFCAGDSLLLTTSFPAGSYTWSNGSTDSSIAVNVPGTYWVQSNYYGCLVRDSVNTLQNTLPIVNLGADTAICNSDSLLLNAGNPGAVYLWQDGSVSQTFNVPDSGLYYVQVRDLNGCIGKDSVNINFYASLQLQLTNDTTICAGNTFMLSANANNAQTYTWSPSGTLSNTGINNPIASPVDTILYTVNVSDIYGCKASDSVLVNVAPLPTVVILADTVICAGDSAQLSTNTTNALSYLWSPSAGLSNANSAAPVATPASSTQYIVTVKTQYGCIAKDSVNVTVNSLPALAAGTLDSLICIGNSTTLAATSPTAVSYSWFPSLGLDDASSATPVAIPVNTTNYYVLAADINGCAAIDSVLVSVKPKPVFAVDPPTAGICTGESVVLTASGGDTYTWFPSNTLSDPNNAITIATPNVTTTYKVVITDNICAVTDSVFTTVNMTSLSSIDVTKSNDVDCILGTSMLRATGGVTYNWFPNKYLSDSTIANPVAAPLETTTYYAQVTNAGGCTGLDSVTVYVLKGSVENGYKLPTAFTPNNDGNNDCFGVRKWGTLANLDLSIYNRWGTLVFHSKNPSDCWDGMYKGQMQPPGAYVYQIRAQALCGTVYRKGTVVLIR